MKISIIGFISLLLLFAAVLAAGDEPTTLTFFVDYEEQQEEDYIEVELQVESSSPSLTQALNQAKQVATEIASISNGYCKQYTKKGKGDCKEAVDMGNYEISPKYQQVRKESVFTAFVVSYQIKVKVFSTDNIGNLVDTLLKLEDLTIKGFGWKPLEEKDSEEEAVKQGSEQGEGLCKQIGQSLGQIKSVEEVKQEKKEEEKKDDEQEEEEEPNVTTYKFEVECAGKSKKSK